MSINGDFVEFLNEDTLVPVQVTPEVSMELAEDVFFMAGPSAYQVWLDEGNVGTKDDFLQDIVEFVVPERLATNAMLITNWNTAIENGWYKANGTATGTPVVAGMFGTVERFDQYVSQTLYRVVADSSVDTMIYRRTSNDTGANWEDWYRVRWSEAELDLRYAPKIGSNGLTGTNLWIKDRRNVLNWSSGVAPNSVGEIVIQTNIGAIINKMIMLRIRGQDHAVNEGIIDLALRTYFNNTPGVTNTSAAVNFGSFRVPSIRFLRRNSDGLLAIAIAVDTSQANWDYPQISVDAQIAYGAVAADSIFDGWSASITTDTTAYTEISTLVPEQVAFTSETVQQFMGTSVNANAATASGVYYVTDTTENIPIATWGILTVRSIGTYASAEIYQTYEKTSIGSGDSNTWRRFRSNTGVWGAWIKQVTDVAEMDALYKPRANHTGTQLASTISDFTEAAQDAIAALLTSGTQVSLTYNDAANTLSITATGADAETMRDTIGAALVGTGNISVVVNDAADTITFSFTGVIPDANLPTRLNAAAPTITDWNTATANGWYKGQNAANQPDVDTGAWWFGQVIVHGGSDLLQNVYKYVGTGSGVGTMVAFSRWRIAGVWGSWLRLHHSQTELDARYAPKIILDANLPPRLQAEHNNDVPGGDWDNAVSTGFYAQSTAANAPEGDTGWHIGMVIAHISTWVTQTVHRFTTDSDTDSKTFRRHRNNGTWTAWYRIRDTEAELDARYKNVGEVVAEAELPARITAMGANVSNWNTVTESGFYRNAAASSLNAPLGSTGFFYGVAVRSANYITVTLWQLNNAKEDTNKFQRVSTDGGATWGAWYRLRESETELDFRYNGGPAYSKIQNYAALVGSATTGVEATAGPYTKDGTTYDQVLARYATGDAGSVLRAYGVDRNGMWTRSFWYKRRGAADVQFDLDIADNPAGGFTATSVWQRAVFRYEIGNFAATIRFSDINFPVAGANIYIFEDSLTFGGQPAPPDTTWIPATLLNSWLNSGNSGYAVAEYRKIGNQVTIRGMVKSGVSGTVAFNLPVGFRPPLAMGISIITGNQTPGRALIGSDGNVSLSVASNVDVHLESITFLVD